MTQQPLAEIMRPKTLSDVVGQDHILGENGMISRSIQSNKPLSIILWGPPGCGKTSLARLYAKAFNLHFVSISAIFSGVADLKKIMKEAEDHPLFQEKTLLFVDEIHRFNKAQQDAFLPYVENGTIILVGATAENPSFHLNPALLSRLRVIPLYSLGPSDLTALIDRYEATFSPLHLTPQARSLLAGLAQGDGRYLFNLIENILAQPQNNELIDENELQRILQKKAPLFDRAGDHHYNLISALHKSVRGSDPDAALYWFCRMLEGGEEPLFLARRLIRMATEDIGLADPQALSLAIAAKDSYQMLGSPEGELGLAEVVVYLALAPKSNALYTAYGAARRAASQSSHLHPPSTILNAPTKLMKEMGYGKDYEYDHDAEDAFSGQNYFPEAMKREIYFKPVERGFEREMKKRIDYFNKLREKRTPN